MVIACVGWPRSMRICVNYKRSVRHRDDLVRTRTAATNQLTALLDAHWPGPKELFQSLASPIALAFLTDYPTPQSAERLGETDGRFLPPTLLPRW